jgi:hypothetical protein
MKRPATTNRYFGQTPDGRHYVRIVHASGERYRTPAYYTLEMAVADGACWEAFRVSETPAETYERMLHDVNAPAADTPVEDLNSGDYVLHTFTMNAADDRKGRRLSDDYKVTRWVRVSGAWLREAARGDRPAQYGYRLDGFTFGEFADQGQTVKVLADPKALEAAQSASRRYNRECFNRIGR